MIAERAVLELDGEWQFVPDPERRFRHDDLPAGETIGVPGCWEASFGPFRQIVTAWYRRRFELPEDWRGYRTSLWFGAVSYQAQAWINGHQVGGHEGGYTPFRFDIGQAVKPGSTNELVVRVTSPANMLGAFPVFSEDELVKTESRMPDLPIRDQPLGKQTWYASLSGIWQSVRLERLGAVALDSLLIRPDVAGEMASVRWKCDAPASSGSPQPIAADLQINILDQEGREAGQVRLAMDPSLLGETVISIPGARRWELEDPFCYQVIARVFHGGELVDCMSADFGMREITAASGAIRLNGRPIQIRGVLDQDVYEDSIWVPPSRVLLEKQFRTLKDLGVNLVRCHLKVPGPAYLDAADSVGILIWCELPSWTRFSSRSAHRARRTLAGMLAALGNHPSVAIWTIVNESWGMELAQKSRDRRWLRAAYAWLKAADPTRLVVDNSACAGNFHVASDLADYHAYFGMPEEAAQWRSVVAELARRPPWLWSTHGDKLERGDEPTVLSEFGNWGLPSLARLASDHRERPWWTSTGEAATRPEGVVERFRDLGLDRIWPDPDAFAESTQWHQFEALQYEIGEIRRHSTLAGFVLTELTDAFWEANGLLDVLRRPKVFHDRLVDLLGPTAIFAELDRRDVWDDEPLRAGVFVSSDTFGREAPASLVEWSLELDDGQVVAGSMPVMREGSSISTGQLIATIPAVRTVVDARLRLTLQDPDRSIQARQDYRLVVFPSSSRRSIAPQRLHVLDESGVGTISEGLRKLGHILTDDARTLVTVGLSPDAIRFADKGGSVVALLGSHPEVAETFDWSSARGLARPLSVQGRRTSSEELTGQIPASAGTWISAFSWILADAFPGLPRRPLLDFAYRDLIPDRVLMGADPKTFAREVLSGTVTGWLTGSGAYIWTFPQGRGHLTVTTYLLSPEVGPVATALLDGLVLHAARPESTSDRYRSSRSGTPEGMSQ